MSFTSNLTNFSLFNLKNLQTIFDFSSLFHARHSALSASFFAQNVASTTTNVISSQYYSLFSSLFSFVLWATISFFVLFYIGVYGLKLTTNIVSNFDNNFTIFSYFSDLEEELGSIDDGILYYLIFGVIISWFFFFTIFYSFFNQIFTVVVSLAFFSVLTAFLVPTFTLKNFGLSFTHYVRGSGKTTSILYETTLDFLAVSIIYIRFLVQNIRFVFIFFAFFELYEFIYFNLDGFVNNALFSQKTNWAYYIVSGYWVNLLLSVVVNWFLFIYYLGHLTILFIAQLAVFFALSFWLFFFMYTSFVLQSHEKYFFFKKLNF